MTTATFDQMSAQMDAKNDIYLKIKACCFELIDALNKDVRNAALAHTQKTSRIFTNLNLASLEFVVDVRVKHRIIGLCATTKVMEKVGFIVLSIKPAGRCMPYHPPSNQDERKRFYTI